VKKLLIFSALFGAVIVTTGWMLCISYVDYLIARYRRLQGPSDNHRQLAIEQLLSMPWGWASWVASGVIVLGIAFVCSLLGFWALVLLSFAGVAALGAMLFSDWQQLQRSEPVQRSVSSAWLEGTRGEYANRRVQLYQSDMIIGRSKECGLLLRDHKVSRQHACLRYASNAWFIQDMNSSGGTFVNGKPIRATRLNTGDQIGIGSSTFIFRA
jgi:hypothetical protein